MKITLGKVIAWLASLAITAAIFVFLAVTLNDGGQTRAELAAVTAATWVVVMLAGLVKIASDQPEYVVLLPGLSYPESTVSNLAPTAVSDTLPAGSAVAVGLTYTMQLSWGFRFGDIARASVTGGVFTTFVKLALPFTAVVGLVLAGEATPGLLVVGVASAVVVGVAVLLFGMILRSERFARRLGDLGERWANRGLHLVRRNLQQGWADAVAGFRDQTEGLVRQRWAMITFTQVLPKVTTALVLLIALRMVGVSSTEVSGVTVWVAYVAATFATIIPITPGGLGVTEAVLVAVLAADQSPEVTAQITVAVIVYRAATWLLPIVLGAPCFVFWRANHSWRRTVAQRYPGPLTTQP